MERLHCDLRPDWERKVESIGLTFHHTHLPNGEETIYWDESAYYRFSAREIDVLERATNELQEMCLAAAQHIIDKKRYAELKIPAAAVPLIERLWEEEPPAIYGRFDLCYDGVNDPKLFEYNADTPTALLEASVAQWYWLEDNFPALDQFNSIHERLIAKWKDVKPYLAGDVLYFCHADARDTEDLMTANYLRDTAAQAGITTSALLMDQIGWNAARRCFTDLEEREIRSLFKLYPWEWLLHEEFGEHLIQTYARVQWIEPIWKMLLSNKGLLPVLWELYPDHPYLLPAYFDQTHELREYARKPLLGREGANVTLVSSDGTFEAPGEYGEEGFVYQAYWPLPSFEGNFPVIGSWVIDGAAAGIGIREARGPITNNTSRFVPHLFEPAA